MAKQPDSIDHGWTLFLTQDEARFCVALVRFAYGMFTGTPTPLEIATGLMIVRSMMGRVDLVALAAKFADLHRQMEQAEHGQN